MLQFSDLWFGMYSPVYKSFLKLKNMILSNPVFNFKSN